jgi:parvulin-like peptidyl-prolyl isomerase
MMKLYCAVVWLLSGIAVAQATSQLPPQGTPPAKPGDVPANAAVITIKGVCRDTKMSPCETAVTRAEFDKLVSALAGARGISPDQIPMQAKRQLAMQYARMLLFAQEAEKLGVEHSPEAQELFHYARLQVLEQLMRSALQQRAKPTAEEIQKHYKDNPDRYKEVMLQRIMVPSHARDASKPGAPDMHKLAEDLRQRAAAGVDFKSLQGEAFEKAGLPNPPETKMTIRSTAVPANHQAVLQLKPGEVSQVLQDPSGYYIYKLDKEQLLPLDQVKLEIQGEVTTQKLQRDFEGLLRAGTPELDPQYFGPPTASPAGVHPLPGTPASPPAHGPATAPPEASPTAK